MNSSRKRVWLFAILMFALLGLRLVTRIWLGGPHTGAPSQDVDNASSVSAQNTPAVPASADMRGSGNVASATGKGIMSEVTALQARILDQILSSKNDDDPRLDTDLKLLSEETKTVFRAKYRAMPPEKHNERGTIVFLLGRNLKTAQDYLFFKEVLRRELHPRKPVGSGRSGSPKRSHRHRPSLPPAHRPQSDPKISAPTHGRPRPARSRASCHRRRTRVALSTCVGVCG